VNPALLKILDIPSQALLGGEYTRRVFLRADGTPMPVQELAGVRALKEGQAVQHVETIVVKEDGRLFRTDMSAVPMALPGWKVVIVTFDLSGRQGVENPPLEPGNVR
jgi:PAS domain-containing protein